MYQLFKCYYIPLEKNISSLYKSMLSVISRIMMFYETDVLEIKCDFFFILSSKLSKKTYDGLGCYLPVKKKRPE